MKKATRALAAFLALVMLLSLCAVGAAAEEKKVYEAVLIIDTSGSMDQSDPPDASNNNARMSIESARAFAYYYPTYADLYITVVVFGGSVGVAIEKVNVSTEAGMLQYEAALDAIANDYQNTDTLPGYDCWTGATDTGSAVAKANEILKKSTADKSAVVLFTDGKTEVWSGYQIDEAATNASVQKAKDSATELGSRSTPVYCVGLDYRGGNIDKEFLNSLSKASNGEARVCSTAAEVRDLFAEIYSLFMGDGEVIEDEYEILPGVETTHTVDIYGDAIREASVALFADTPITKYTVKTPSGLVAVNVDTTIGKVEINQKLCKVESSSNNEMINIKLIYPTDGNWVIGMTSNTPGRVEVRQINLYNLIVDSNAPEKVVAGNTYKFSAALYNEDTKTAITNTRVYANSNCEVLISAAGGGANNVGGATLNGAKTGFDYETVLNTPGKYDVTVICKVLDAQKNAVLTIEKTSQVEVLALVPVLTLAEGNGTLGGSITMKLSFKDPVTNKAVTTLPEYLTGLKGKVVMTNAAGDATTVEIPTADFTSGEGVAVFTPEQIGTYTFSASVTASTNTYDATVSNASIEVKAHDTIISAGADSAISGESVEVKIEYAEPGTTNKVNALPDYLEGYKYVVDLVCGGEKIDSKEIPTSAFADGALKTSLKTGKSGSYSVTVSAYNSKGELVSTYENALDKNITVSNSTISVNDGVGIEDVAVKNFDGQYEIEFSIEGLFADSDGDALTYKVVADDATNVIGTVNGNTVKLTVTNFTEGAVKIVAEDAYGASAEYSLNVSVQSAVGTLILIIVLIVVLIVLVIVALIVINKRKYIRIKFNVKITHSGDNSDGAIYKVVKLAGKRSAKPTMTLAEILSNGSLAERDDDGSFSGALVDEFIAKDAKGITLTGLVASNGFTVAYTKNNKKLTVQFLKGQKTITVGEYTISFGSASAFI